MLDLMVSAPRAVEVEDSGALSKAQRALATVSPCIKQAVPLMLAPQKS